MNISKSDLFINTISIGLQVFFIMTVYAALAAKTHKRRRTYQSLPSFHIFVFTTIS